MCDESPRRIVERSRKNSWRNNSLKFPSLTENMNLWIQEAQIIQIILMKIFTPIHIIVKWNTKKKSQKQQEKMDTPYTDGNMSLS